MYITDRIIEALILTYGGLMFRFATTDQKSNFNLIKLATSSYSLAIDMADLSRLDLEQVTSLIEIDGTIVHKLSERFRSNPDILLLVIRKLEEKINKLEDKIYELDSSLY